MSNVKYVNDMKTLMTMEGPVTKGPAPRYNRKPGQENSLSMSNLSLNSSKHRSFSTSMTSKSPSRTRPTPHKGKRSHGTPTPGKLVKTPADRFIPNRSAMNFELAHYMLTQDENQSDLSPTQREKQRLMSEKLHGFNIDQQKILAYRNKAPSAPEGFQNPMRVMYTQTKTPAGAKNATRYIPQAPDRILDAPDIVDDYYLNLIDWGSNNVLAAALGSHVYLWNAGTGNIEELLELQGDDYVCSLAWVREGENLAVGTTTGTVELWDCARMKRLRVMSGHSARVASLSWNSFVLSSGSRNGQIVHHDVRQREHVVSTIAAHSQEVCGLKWSPDGRYLASGGNDNMLNIWQAAGGGSHHSQQRPLHTFSQHQAAVKALAWCPWQPHVLASGGGTADRHIRFWNCNTGACVNAIDAKSQVCSLLWSSTYKEIVSGHGFANNELIIWKYPGMTKVAELTGHTARVLHLAMSPDGTTVLSAGADETLRLWKCFIKDPSKAKTGISVREKPSALKACIR